MKIFNKTNKPIILGSFILFFLFFLGLTQVYSQSACSDQLSGLNRFKSCQVNVGDTLTVNAENCINPCYKIINSTSNNLFVPTNTCAEWDAFLTHLPTGITTDTCVLPSIFVPVGAQGYDASGNLVIARSASGTLTDAAGQVVFLDAKDYGTVTNTLGTADVLVVAGGGGGGGNNSGGGGGGGGVVNQDSITISSSVSIVVGGGGAGGSTTEMNNGINSSIGSIIAYGGGAGGGISQAGNSGGSGGGSGRTSAQGNGTTAGGIGTTGQGYNGGSATRDIAAHTVAGGGGAGGAGENSSTSGPQFGAGGPGKLVWGSYYGGGGGGGSYIVGVGGGLGGVGGGINGSFGSAKPSTPNSSNNTGGGGGGGYPGSNGNSGIVIIRWGGYDYDYWKCGFDIVDSRDGQKYSTVEIGGNCWMSENMKYLPSVVGSGTNSTTIPYYYVMQYQGTSVSTAKATHNFKIFGVHYNQPAAMSACPSGWHLPSATEYAQLFALNTTSGSCLGSCIANCYQCEGSAIPNRSPNTYPEGNGTNTTGFNQFVGSGWVTGGSFYGPSSGEYTFFWTSTTGVNIHTMYSWNKYYFHNTYGQDVGATVRCIKD